MVLLLNILLGSRPRLVVLANVGVSLSELYENVVQLTMCKLKVLSNKLFPSHVVTGIPKMNKIAWWISHEVCGGLYTR